MVSTYPGATEVLGMLRSAGSLRVPVVSAIATRGDIVYDRTPSGDLYLGKDPGVGEAFKGIIDGAGVWGRVLSAGEVVGPSRVSGFFEQVGRNTDYLIHPEEILAENFALLVLNERQVASRAILQRIREILMRR